LTDNKPAVPFERAVQAVLKASYSEEPLTRTEAEELVTDAQEHPWTVYKLKHPDAYTHVANDPFIEEKD
jgi:hypothetical protein